MKKWLFLVVCACVVSFAKADNDKVITFEQLPAAARTFIQRHFPSEKVAFVKAERDWLDTSYDVHFIIPTPVFRKSSATAMSTRSVCPTSWRSSSISPST